MKHHVKDELGKFVDVLARSVHDHHGLLFTSLQVSVVTRWYSERQKKSVLALRTSSISRLVHPLWARCVDQRGTLRHLHEHILVDGVLGLWRQTHFVGGIPGL